jgi:8-oxo-dGTP pyrophosphatase MutT (NUDIX family)
MSADGGVKRCDNASVGVVIERDGRYLVFTRATFPAGVAPCAGHVFDDHDGYEAAAAAEAREELGLTVTSLDLAVAREWRANRCRRLRGPQGTGHWWQVYRATVSGTLRPSPRETRSARWADPAELQTLAARTARYARGEVTDGEFARNPGIEPVWVRWLCDLGVITASAFAGREADLALIEHVAETGQA